MRPLIAGALLFLSAMVSGSMPSTFSGHWAEIRGHRLYYEISGSGRPLLLLHGGGASVSTSFPHQLETFAAHHQIIAPEQVGQGRSPPTPGPLCYTEMMEDTAALLEQLHVRDVDVVGWSDGGILALMLAVRHPHLVHRVVISGVNISPDGLLDTEITALRNFDPAESADTEHADEKLRQLWLSAPTAHELNVDILQRLNKPVLVLAGDHDVIKLDHTLQIYLALPRAQLSVLPDTGHATFAQRPEWVNPLVLQFLAKND